MVKDIESEKEKINATIFTQKMNDEEGCNYVLKKLREYDDTNDIDKQIACHELLYFRYKYTVLRYELLNLYSTAGYSFQAEGLKELIDEQNAKNTKDFINNNQESNKINTSTNAGCYIATCIYGTYDCPQVWTLRRFRDDTLAANIFGRIFIKIYYFVSPILVKYFGKYKWFHNFFEKPLNKLIIRLNKKGVQNTPYIDKERL